MNIFEVNGHHLAVMAKYWISDYGSDVWASSLNDLVDSCAISSDISIKIVACKDFVCKGCTRKEGGCYVFDEDAFILKEYGFVVGDIINGGKLLGILNDYKDKSNYLTPRDLFNELYVMDYPFPLTDNYA